MKGTWRRRPDGRPYADVWKDGKRYRVTLLPPDVAAKCPPWPTDEQCQIIFDGFCRNIYPTLGQAPAAVLSDSSTLGCLFDWYVDTIQPSRGDTEGTRESNRRILSGMAAWFATRNYSTVKELYAQPHVIHEWVTARLRDAKPSTVTKELSIFRAVFRAAVASGILDRLPLGEWPRIKRPARQYPEPLTPSEFAALLNRLRDGTVSAEGRHYPSTIYNIVRFIAFTGCRPIDACQLRRDALIDIEGSDPRAMIHQQKTRQLVSVALSAPAVAAVCDELARGVTSVLVFTNRHRERFTPGTISAALRHHSAALGIRPITPKTFRQTLVSVLTDAGADSEAIQRITGHRSDAIQAYRLLRKRAAHEHAAEFARLITTEHPGDGSGDADTSPEPPNPLPQ